MTSVYLDAASTTPLHPVAKQALDVAMADGWADPTKLHGQGRRAQQLLDAARGGVAEVLAVGDDEVRFTHSGTAAVHSGLIGALDGNRRQGNVLIHSEVEHSSVLHAAAWHEQRGGRAFGFPVDRSGRVRLDRLRDVVAEVAPTVVAAQSANHEVGTVQPVAEIADICGPAVLVVDAAQSLGHMPIPSGWSVLTGSARKWGGPAGVGLLVVDKNTRWRNPWPHDPGQPLATGAVNLPAIVAAAASLRAMIAERDANDRRLRRLTDLIRRRAAEIGWVEVVGNPHERLPHIVTFSYPFEDGEPMLLALDKAGFEVSAGSSCTAATIRPSHVLEAMGVLSHGNIRVSLHRGVTDDDVERFTRALPEVMKQLRDEGGVVE